MHEFRTSLFRTGTVARRAVTTATLAALLAGCAAQNGGAPAMRAEPTFMRLTEERVFAQALRQRYLELATDAYDRGDFDRSDFYSLRAIMAVEGKLADPAGAGTQVTGELAPVRGRLARVLSAQTRLGSPDLAARAQAAFDCWWLESQSGGDRRIAEACAYNARAALAELESVASGRHFARTGSTPQQIVIGSDTPSQRMQVGGAMIEVINERAAPVPSAHRPAAPQPPRVAPAPLPQAAPIQVPPMPMAAPTIPTVPIESERAYVPPPVEQPSTRTFALEPAAPLDRVVPTVPILPGSGPVDLLTSDVPETGAPLGGQYVVAEMDSYAAAMIPIYDDPIPQAAPVFSNGSEPLVQTAPMMIEQNGGVLSSLIEARSSGTGDYAVYFGFDSDAITPEGADVLGDLIEQIKLEGRTAVALMGFTDSAGDSRYNQLLAMRRANAVRQFIQRRTDGTIRFEVMPVGEAEAVQNGGDGVTDALNRRVEIILR